VSRWSVSTEPRSTSSPRGRDRDGRRIFICTVLLPGCISGRPATAPDQIALLGSLRAGMTPKKPSSDRRVRAMREIGLPSSWI
jgi:hypothetical protein